MQSCHCTAQVCCDIVSFGKISVRYVQLVKQNLVHACRLAVSVVRYVYAFWNYLSKCLQQSGTPPSAAWRHTTLQPAFWNLLGFKYRRVTPKNFSGEALSYKPYLFLVRVSLQELLLKSVLVYCSPIFEAWKVPKRPVEVLCDVTPDLAAH